MQNLSDLPAGVHVLSAESQAALARAKEKGDAIAARHTKPARLAAASIDQRIGSQAVDGTGLLTPRDSLPA